MHLAQIPAFNFSGFVQVNIYLSKANKRRKTAILKLGSNDLFFSFREEETYVLMNFEKLILKNSF